jgi:hypothetical protein
VTASLEEKAGADDVRRHDGLSADAATEVASLIRAGRPGARRNRPLEWRYMNS